MKEKEVLSLLSNVGECYRKDLILAMNDKNTNESVILNRLLKLGYILESTIVCNEDSRNKIVKTLTITNKGRIRLSNIMKNAYPHKIGNIVNKRFASTNPKERHIELGKSKIQLFLNQSGVRVFPQDKPSFPHIYNQVIATTYDLPNEWMYNNSITTPDTLETGVYFFGCNKCGTVCMTTKLPFDDWHECPTCRQMIHLNNVRRKVIRIADDGQAWLEMLKEATEE